MQHIVASNSDPLALVVLLRNVRLILIGQAPVEPGPIAPMHP